MNGVRVKHLAWASIDGDDETGTGRHWVSAGMHGDYCVEERFDGGFDLWAPNTPEPDPHVSLEAAKAAAQADYETRILAALEPQDAPAMAGVEIPAGYTPGPWVVEECHVWPGCWCAVVVPANVTDPDRDCVVPSGSVRREDAHLIALAPAMAEELVALRAILSDAREHISSDREVLPRFFSGPNTSALMAEADALLARIDAAITPEAKS